MRYLLDTNIFVYIVAEPDLLCADVNAILEDYDNQFYISAESVRELIVAYHNKGLFSKRWKTAADMVRDIEETYNIGILSLGKEHMYTYSALRLNEAQGHKDPSDHVIIAHAITEHLALISSDTRFDFYRKQGLELVFNKK